MAIKRTRKANPNFNMSSMTDIVFLLLIFFMVTSTLINPNALKLLLPKSSNQTSNQPTVVVSIDKKLTFYLNTKVTPFSKLETPTYHIPKICFFQVPLRFQALHL